MADSKISALTEATTLARADLFAIATGGANRKVQWTTILNEIELDYVQNTSAVNLTATSESTPTTVVTGSDLTVDGTTVLLVEFYARGLSSPGNAAGDFSILNLHVSTNGGSSYSDIGRIAAVQTATTQVTVAPVHVARRVTPANGTAKYRIVGWVNTTTGTPSVQSGAGGAATGMPMFIRVTRVL